MTTVADVLHRAADSAADAYPAEAFIERHGAALYRGVRRRRVRRTVTQTTVSVAAAGAAVWGVVSLPGHVNSVSPAGVVCTTPAHVLSEHPPLRVAMVRVDERTARPGEPVVLIRLYMDGSDSVDPHFVVPGFIDEHTGESSWEAGLITARLTPDGLIESASAVQTFTRWNEPRTTTVLVDNDPLTMRHRLTLQGTEFLMAEEYDIVTTLEDGTPVTITVSTTTPDSTPVCVTPAPTISTPVPLLTPVPAPSAHEEYTTTQGIHIFGIGPESGFLLDYVIDPQSTVGATVDPGLVGSVMVSVDDDHTVTRVELLSVGGDPVPEASWYYAGDASGLVIYVDSSLVPYLAEPLTFGEASALQGTRELNLGPLVIVPVSEVS